MSKRVIVIGGGPAGMMAAVTAAERGAQVTGTGHNCMFRTTAGELMICYHGRTEATGTDRIAFISPAHFDEQGRLVIDAE